jgi:hypothetical protein
MAPPPPHDYPALPDAGAPKAGAKYTAANAATRSRTDKPERT